jgi:hypothetical protein
MPIIHDNNQAILVCVNAHPPQGPGVQSTMVVLEQWGYLPGIAPPPPQQGVVVPPVALLNTAFPVRIYRCAVCGYVELYSGVIIAPQVWGQNG